MLGNVWEWIIGQLADAFGISGKNGMQQALSNLYQMPLPPLDHPQFKAIYAITWALGIVISIFTGAISALMVIGKSTNSIGNAITTAERFVFFWRVIAVGFLAPPATAVFLIIGQGITDATKGSSDGTGIASLQSAVTTPDPTMSALSVIPNFLASWTLTIETAFVIIGVFPVLALFAIFYSFSVAGSAGLALWRWWIGIYLLTVTIKPILALLLWVGNAFAQLIKQIPVVGGAAGWFSLGILLFAATVPIFLGFLYYKKDGISGTISPAFIPGGNMSGSHSGHGSGGGRILTAAAAGASYIAGRMQDGPSERTPRTSGSKRMQASGLLKTGATIASKSHPVLAVASTLGSVAIGASGSRAARKQNLNSMPPPTGQPVAIRPPVVKSRPSATNTVEKPVSTIQSPIVEYPSRKIRKEK